MTSCAFIYFFPISILLSNDVQLNPGPRLTYRNLYVSHWNANSLSVNNFSKVDLISGYEINNLFISLFDVNIFSGVVPQNYGEHSFRLTLELFSLFLYHRLLCAKLSTSHLNHIKPQREPVQG